MTLVWPWGLFHLRLYHMTWSKPWSYVWPSSLDQFTGFRSACWKHHMWKFALLRGTAVPSWYMDLRLIKEAGEAVVSHYSTAHFSNIAKTGPDEWLSRHFSCFYAPYSSEHIRRLAPCANNAASKELWILWIMHFFIYISLVVLTCHQYLGSINKN